jgi:uncharacterized protein YqeY
MTTALKARDTFATTALRMLVGAIRTAEKAGKVARELTEDEVQAVLVSEMKKRRDSADSYASVGADDRADTERAEADLIESYLPAALDDAALDALVADAITQAGASSMKDMGAVMKAAQAAAAERGVRVDGKVLSTKVRAALG